MDRASYSNKKHPQASVSTLYPHGDEEHAVSADAPRHKPCLSYQEAGDILGVSADSVRTLVDAGVLDRPLWSREEVRVALVTTVSVYEAAGWPVRALEPL